MDTYEIGDKVTLKKPHACGGGVWTIVRLGADVKLQCDGCKRYVNLTRDDLKRRIKRLDKGENDKTE